MSEFGVALYIDFAVQKVYYLFNVYKWESQLDSLQCCSCFLVTGLLHLSSVLCLLASLFSVNGILRRI